MGAGCPVNYWRALIAAGGYMLNDVFDYRLDCRTHPAGAPQGQLELKFVKVCALMLLIGAPLIFLWVNPLTLINAILSASLLFLYSWWLKKTCGLLGNLSVALLASNCILLGGLVVGSLGVCSLLCPAYFWVPGRAEISKDIEDLPGDRGLRRNTLPMLIGSSKSTAGRLAARIGRFCELFALPARHFQCILPDSCISDQFTCALHPVALIVCFATQYEIHPTPDQNRNVPVYVYLFGSGPIAVTQNQPMSTHSKFTRYDIAPFLRLHVIGSPGVCLF